MDSEKTLSFFANLIQPFDESMLIINTQGDILVATDRAIQLFNKDIIQQSIFSIITDEKDKFNHWLSQANAYRSAVFLFNLKTEKKLFPMRVNAFSWPTESGELILLSMKDDSEIYRIQKDILKKSHAIEHFSKSRKIRDGKLKEAIYEILEMSSKATDTKRVSVWKIPEDKNGINCLGSYDGSTKSFLEENQLPRIEMTEYFKLYEKSNIILSNDTFHSMVTEELRENYLVPHNIQAMMDVPVRIDGEIIGVICFENIGSKRDWSLQDQKFGLISAQMVSLALESYDKKLFQTKLEEALHQQQNLFRESNHRIKNNLAIISSLISLQSHHCKDEYHADLFSDLKNRVLSIASLHDLLNKSETAEKINFKTYITEILANLKSSFTLVHPSIEMHSEVENVFIKISQAVPLGLIVNEIITNSYKHAFENDATGKIEISISEQDSKLILALKDNGKGFQLTTKKDTLGLEIIEDLVAQLDGKIEIASQIGTSFIIEVDLN